MSPKSPVIIAAVYARKSDDNVASVDRQVDIAQRFIASQPGWVVGPVFKDNDISGGRFDRPGLTALLAATAAPLREFSALVMMDASRLGRDMAETLPLQLKLTKQGVRIWHYQSRSELVLATPTDKLKASIDNYSSEDYKYQVARKVREAQDAKHRQGHVANGTCFGYVNVPHGRKPSGKPEYVTRELDPAQAQVVRQIFTRYTDGLGTRKIAAELNAAHVPAPRAKQGKSWSQEQVRDMLANAHYIGQVTYRGVVRVDEPLRIIPQSLWDAVQARLASAKAIYLRGTKGQLQSKPLNGTAQQHLLSGLLRCHCGGPLQARVSNTRYWRCRNSYAGLCRDYAVITMKRLDAAILTAVQAHLEPDLVAGYLYKLTHVLPDPAAERAALTTQLAQATQACANLAAAIAQGGDLATLVTTLQATETRKAALAQALASLTQRPVRPTGTLEAWGRKVEEVARLGGYLGLAQAHPARARQLLGKLLVDRITLTPLPDGGLRFEGQVSLHPLAEPLGFSSVLAGASRTESPRSTTSPLVQVLTGVIAA